MTTVEAIVPDTSVIAEGLVTRYLKEGKFKPKKIIIPEAVINELEHQANKGRETGYIGLDEIKELQASKYKVEFLGARPGEFEIKFAKSGAVDNLIREIARNENAVLMTADRVQALVAEAQGIKVEFIDFSKDEDSLDDPLKKFFTKETMSVHIKEDAKAIAKRGKPGSWKFVELKQELNSDDIKELAKAIVETAHIRKDGFIEKEGKGSTIVQLGNYRIVIIKPPFGSSWEITAVRPVARLALKDYKLSELLTKRLEERAEGILISGSPGEGKSTFTQALAEFYSSKEKIVKTIEAPRDLVLPKTITQYSLGHASNEEIRDVLLLSRPDYTVFDEVRNTKDFHLFADLRLSGVGMIGVVHATAPVDSIQRFIGRIELGMVPQVIDTVIFIKAGQIKKVYTLEILVKVPEGMTESDLARPVVLVKDFHTDKREFEIYTYGDNTVVMPVKGEEKKNPLHSLAEQALEDYFGRFTSRVKAEIITDGKATVFVPEDRIAQIIGKGGSTIELIEKDLGMKIDIQALKGRERAQKHKHIDWSFQIAKKNLTLTLPTIYANQEVHVYEGKNYLLTAITSKKAQIKISHKSGIGKAVRQAIEHDRLEIKQ